MIALILCLAMAGAGKDYSLLLSTAVCCMVTAVAMSFLAPVVTFFRDLEEMISLDHDLLEILLKAVGIGVVGEVAAMICTDSGNSALGKTIQLLSSVLILWLSLPLLETMLDLIRELLEGI